MSGQRDGDCWSLLETRYGAGPDEEIARRPPSSRERTVDVSAVTEAPSRPGLDRPTHKERRSGMTDPERDHNLLMPFVVCVSVGGPYEDESFCVGFEAGEINGALAHQPPIYERYVHSPLVPQLDLIAMRYGYQLTATPWDEVPDEWTWVTFRLAGTTPQETQ